MKNLILFLGVFVSLLFSFNNQAKASHYMGGEITWECLTTGVNAGKYIFTMKVYRECNGINFGTTQTLSSTSPVTSIPMNIVPGWPKDISPKCNGIGPAITCAGVTQDNTGAVEEFVYRSQPVQISGVPPANGWEFYWESCCRNPCDNVPGASGLGWRLRAKMYPYQNMNAYPCFDDSPVFAEISRSVITAGYPFTYNHNAYDKQLDSLSFEWGQPLDEGGAPINFGPGYSFSSPLPGTAQNVNNVPATVNVYTGEISFTSYTTGAFVTSTKVSAFRCGTLVAEIWRDMQVVLLTGVNNNPPNVTPPFASGTLFVDTVLAGDSVCFNLSATDFEFLPNGSPQTMEITASGLQFGAFIPGSGGSQPTMSSSYGCLNPPCAVLTPAPGPGSPLTGVFGVQTDFCWHTDCSHLATQLGCGVESNVYTFVFKVEDDFCPAPASNISTITIIVNQKPTVDMPEIQCLKVQPNGDVDLSWSMPNDTADSFLSYRIYSSATPAGPYVEIDSIFDINQLSYHHTGANAGSAPIYYTMKLVSGCDIYSDSVAATPIFLSVNNSNNGTALLNWNATHTPLLSTSASYYHIYREYPTGTWTMIDSTMSTNYTDTISDCGDTINYRIEIIDTGMVDTAGVHYSCNSISNVAGDYFSDIIAPDIPVIDSVSVDPITGFTTIAWDSSAAGDIGGYIIYIEQNGAWTPIDTLWTKNAILTYVDQVNSACGSAAGFNSYKVAAFDTCFTASHPQNLSPLSLPHNTIGLTAVKDVCDDLITLTWNAYNNMTSGIAAYDIFVSENGGPVTLLNSSPATATSYAHVGLNSGSTYTYLVHARDNSGTRFSSSCVKSETATMPAPPKFVYIRTASVLPSNKGVFVKLHTDTTGKVSEYLIERYDPSAATWNQVGTVPPDYTNPTITYTDMTALVRQQWYKYRAIVVDSCGKDVDTSQVAKTMLLKVVANDDLSNDLTWNAYEGFSGSPTVFEVYRGVDGVWDPIPVATLPKTVTTYTDDVQGLSSSGGTFDYYVNAVEGGGNIYNLSSDSSRSNTVQAFQKPKLYVPSAFNPQSTDPRNRTFYPVGVFVNSKDYTFIIFNRWGEKLFETTEINKGWDGTYNGSDSPQGVYTYYVKFTTADNREFEKRGTVTLIR